MVFLSGMTTQHILLLLPKDLYLFLNHFTSEIVVIHHFVCVNNLIHFAVYKSPYPSSYGKVIFSLIFSSVK